MLPSLEPRLRELVSTFLKENAKLNLSAFRTEETCWIGNVLDSLALLDLPFMQEKLPDSSIPRPLPPGEEGVIRKNPLTDNMKIISSHSPPLSEEGLGVEDLRGRTLLDIGTGGGFPLLPLSIALPDVQFTGLDSVGKKIAAVERIVATLNLTNVRCISGRAEEFGRMREYREMFDIVTLRAVAELSTLLEYASAFVKVGGRIVVWKSVHMEKELEESLLARAEFSCHLKDTYAYELPGNFGKRQLLIFEKTAPLSPKYPRPVGVPKKQPLR